MRILVTNDDGVHAPGLAALVRALDEWVVAAADGETRDVVVVAPLANQSGASAAVGTVYERESIGYRAVRIDGVENIAVYGLDASPALSTIVGSLGGFGPKPDLIFSGINLGVNVGRSVLHSGTVGAVLTGAQLGVSGLAVSMRSGADPTPWETASATAVALIPALAAAPPGTVLNLNLPSVPLKELKGIRRARVGTAGIIKAAQDPAHPADDATTGRVGGGPFESGSRQGEIRLRLGAAVPSLGDIADEDPDDDASLVAAGYASLTPIVGVREETGPRADGLLEAAMRDVEQFLS